MERGYMDMPEHGLSCNFPELHEGDGPGPKYAVVVDIYPERVFGSNSVVLEYCTGDADHLFISDDCLGLLEKLNHPKAVYGG